MAGVRVHLTPAGDSPKRNQLFTKCNLASPKWPVIRSNHPPPPVALLSPGHIGAELPRTGLSIWLPQNDLKRHPMGPALPFGSPTV